MPNISQVRTISIDELDDVRNLAMQIWPKHHRSHIAPGDMDSTISALFDLDQMEADMRDGGHAHFIVRVGRVDVGFCSAHLEGSRIWVTHLYVMQDFRGHGLGKSLIRAAQEHFAPARDLVLFVHKNERSSVEFCLRSGFAVQREISSQHKYVNPSQRVAA
ncbi:MAG: GNAT family N-acetyltransferase [Asticcacaulis sp.]|nr:GNAT family N-acetyltransferase [Asticcacaulis sp.]